MDRTAVTIQSLHDEPDDKRWWWSRTPLERLAAIEVMRRVVYGHAAADGRLQRVLEVAQGRAVTFDLGGVSVPVISLTDLKANKRAAGRHKDLADLDNLP